MQSRLRYGFRTYEYRGQFKTRLDLLDKEIMSLRGYERLLSTTEKEKLAEIYEAIAAHCLKAATLIELDEQKLEQKQAPAMAMA